MDTTHDLLKLRWRSAQLLRAACDGNATAVGALRQAMRIEGIDPVDVTDELRLLVRQFGHRPAYALGDEVARLWSKLKERDR